MPLASPFPRATEVLWRIETIRTSLGPSHPKLGKLNGWLQSIVNGAGTQLFPLGNDTSSSAFLRAFETWPQVAEQALTYYEMAEAGLDGQSFFEIQHQEVQTTVAGRNNYRIPVGCWQQKYTPFALYVDKGSGEELFLEGVDYNLLSRVSPPGTVADATIGWSLVGVVSAGWQMRYTWTERVLKVQPPPLAKVFLTGGVIDNSVAWDPQGTSAPNGVLIPEIPGMHVEFWRETRRNGGKRGKNGTIFRGGRRYVPYFRGGLDQFLFSVADFDSALHPAYRRKFRVCYTDPETGARSPLSNDIIVVNCVSRDDRLENAGVVRYRGSVWLE